VLFESQQPWQVPPLPQVPGPASGTPVQVPPLQLWPAKQWVQALALLPQKLVFPGGVLICSWQFPWLSQQPKHVWGKQAGLPAPQPGATAPSNPKSNPMPNAFQTIDFPSLLTRLGFAGGAKEHGPALQGNSSSSRGGGRVAAGSS